MFFPTRLFTSVAPAAADITTIPSDITTSANAKHGCVLFENTTPPPHPQGPWRARIEDDSGLSPEDTAEAGFAFVFAPSISPSCDLFATDVTGC